MIQRASSFPESADRESKQDRNQQDLQDASFGEAADDGVGNDVEQELRDTLLFRVTRIGRERRSIERRGIDIESLSRSDPVRNDETDDECECRDDLEVDQCPDANAPTLFMSRMPAMPETTVQKMMKGISILISLMNPSPSGFSATAV